MYPAACTCPGESHPGPMRSDGSYVGRSAPEIDIFEATVIHNVKGQVWEKKLLMFVFADVRQVSVSGQWAPYNVGLRLRIPLTLLFNYDCYCRRRI